MKYKINYKANDEAYDNSSIIKFLVDNGYRYYDSNSTASILFFKKDKDNIRLRLSVDFKKQWVYKYKLLSPDTNNGKIEANFPFTKEELKFFDSLDFEVAPVRMIEDKNLQDITDWTGM